MKARKLGFVQRMIRLIGAGQMRHQQLGACVQQIGGHGLPFHLVHAQPVHAGVQLHAKGMAGQRFQMARHLIQAVEHWCQVKIGDHVGVARHVA